MIIVSDTFVCKPGNASKAAKLFKEMMAGNKNFLHLLTDMTGQYHRVIMMSQFEDLTAYEKSWQEMAQNPEDAKKWDEEMKKLGDWYISGSREIYRVW